MMTVLAFLTQSWVGKLVTYVIGLFADRAAQVQRAAEQVRDDLQAHADDGAKSVNIRDSYDQQMDLLQKQLDQNQKEVNQNGSEKA